VPAFERRWQAYAWPVGDSWRVDETYLKLKGQWVYLYRAVDKGSRTVDFLLSRRRDMAAAKRFFSRATKEHGAPRVITLDGYAASHQAVAGFKRFETAAVTTRGIELAEKIKKHQFNLRPLTGKAITAPEMWAAVLAA
jgi:transposase-like protein